MKPMAGKHMRSPFGRAIGLGSAKEGVETWWRERVTAVALVPLTLWFMGSMIAHSASDYAHFVSWLKMPAPTFLMALLLIGLFYHTALGLQVIIEDYIHSAAKLPALILMRLACFSLAVAGILAILRVALVS
jgi:succinate dehydrogenase membrane anchor subunit